MGISREVRAVPKKATSPPHLIVLVHTRELDTQDTQSQILLKLARYLELSFREQYLFKRSRRGPRCMPRNARVLVCACACADALRTRIAMHRC